jgi:hypothetical protein
MRHNHLRGAVSGGPSGTDCTADVVKPQEAMPLAVDAESPRVNQGLLQRQTRHRLECSPSPVGPAAGMALAMPSQARSGLDSKEVARGRK